MRRCDDVVHPSSGYGCGIFEWIHILFVAVVFAGIINGAVFQVMTVEQYSMEPTFYEGNRVYMSKCSYWFSSPKFGDIVIFYNDSSDSNYVKRVIGEPGDVPEGKYFCLGDNRNVSIDSRHSSVGCIPADRILGKVVYKVLPFGSIKNR